MFVFVVVPTSHGHGTHYFWDDHIFGILFEVCHAGLSVVEIVFQLEDRLSLWDERKGRLGLFAICQKVSFFSSNVSS